MDRKNELCTKALEYILEHGLADLSLRPLATKAGTSARLLVYHFGSKDGLIAAVMEQARLHVQKSIAESLRNRGKRGPLQCFWSWATHPGNSPFVRLLFEVQVLALQNRAAYGRYLKGTTASWLTLIEQQLPSSPNRRSTATLFAAVIDGLLLEFLSSGDLRRTSASLQLFGSLWQRKSRR